MVPQAVLGEMQMSGFPPSPANSQFFWRRGPRNLFLNKLSKGSMTSQTWGVLAQRLPFIDEGELVGDSFGVLLCAVWIDPWGGSKPGRTGAAGRTGGECVCGPGSAEQISR